MRSFARCDRVIGLPSASDSAALRAHWSAHDAMPRIPGRAEASLSVMPDRTRSKKIGTPIMISGSTSAIAGTT
jgi:hypothetical protein